MRTHRTRTAILLAATVMALAPQLAFAVIGGATIVVNTPNDEFGTVPQNCSLREAVQTANTNADFGGCTHTGNFATGSNSDLVQLPAADPGYALARTGAEDDTNVNGDIDIASNITISGAGAGTTPIFVCAACPERVIEVVSGTNVDIEDVTLKLGHPPGDGGGLYNNAGTNLTLTRVTIGQNVTVGNGGGIYNLGTLTINQSAITNNEITRQLGGGGGIHNANAGILTLNDSRVLNNTATRVPSGDNALFGGGGIFSGGNATLVLDNSTVDGNTVKDTGIFDFPGAGGGGILVTGDFAITRSTISNNSSIEDNDAPGGGIACQGQSVIGTIDHSVISGNASNIGGGIFCGNGELNGLGLLVITDSIVRDNGCDQDVGAAAGGGMYLFDIEATIANTTISDNHVCGSGSGGGVYATTAVRLTLLDSTLSGNEADEDGGGLYVFSAADVSLSNVTIAGNTSNADGLAGGAGGGIYIAGNGTSAIARNTVLAGNLEQGIGDHDDCDGLLESDGNNLVQNPSGCSIGGVTEGNLLSVNAKLGALADNGGDTAGADNASNIPEPILTRRPANDSPLLDAGRATGCLTQGGALIATDQRGFARSVDGPDLDVVDTCDIGAVEVLGLGNLLFADGYE